MTAANGEGACRKRPPPLLVWSWSAHGGSAWHPALRIRALAVGQALAARAGYRVVTYLDDAAFSELAPLRWPWRIRALPTHQLPRWFWSGTKLVALRDACEREPRGGTVAHVDVDAMVCGALPQAGSGMFADGEHSIDAHPVLYPLGDLHDAIGTDLPPFWEPLTRHRRASGCSVFGGADRDGLEGYFRQVFDAVGVIEARGRGDRRFTWALEQASFFACAVGRGAPPAVEREARGEHRRLLIWPGERQNDLGPFVCALEHLVPEELRLGIVRRWPTIPPPLQPYPPWLVRVMHRLA